MSLSRHIVSVVAIGILLMARTTSAQTIWDGSSSNAWGTGANWNTGTVPGTTTNVQFNTLGGMASTVTLGATNRTANILTFNSTNSFNIIGSGTRTLTLTAGDITTTASNSGSQSLTFTTLALGANADFNINGTGDFTIQSIVANNGATARSVTKIGTGTLILSGANTFTGGLTVSAGTVGFGNNAAAGTGTLTLSGGTIYADSAARTLTNATTVSGNFAVSGTDNLTLSGNMGLGAATRTVTVSNTGLTTFSGIISNTSGGMTKAGTGTLALSGANTFTGNITVSAGTLRVANDGNLGNTANDLTLNGGTLETTGTFTMNAGRVVTVGASNGTIDVDSGTTLTLGTTGQLTGSGNLAKTDSGTLAISASNTGYTGNTALNGGIVRLNAYDSLGTSTANILTISNGAELDANFANATNFQSNILINDGTIRRTNNTATKAGFQNNVGTSTLTVAGTAQVVDQGGDNANGFLTLDGVVNVNTGGALTLTATTANDEIRLGGAQNVNLAAGSSLTTSGSGLVSFGSGSARTIVGQGTSTQESTIVLGAASNTANAGTKFQVNGSGTGGLRLQGTQAKVDSLATDARLAATAGTGGTLTVAYTDAGTRTISSAANLAANSSVVLGLESNGGTFTLGTAGGGTGDLANWGGLTVGNNTAATFADNNVFGSGDSLTLLGGTLNLNNTIQSFGTLSVTADSIIDFSGSNSELNLVNFIISAGVTLTIQNWQNAVNFFSSANWTGGTHDTMGASPMNQVVFSGFNPNQTIWDSMDNQIRPNVPEPSTYGAFLLGALLGLAALWRVRQQRLAAVVVRRVDRTRLQR